MSSAVATAGKLSTYNTQGKVKWFDPAKRYGFIVPDDNSGDILIHISCLAKSRWMDEFGPGKRPDGAVVEVEFMESDGLRQAIELLAFEPSKDETPLSTVNLDRSQYEGTIKWFKGDRGFGFIVCDELPGQDIFIHSECLRRHGLPREPSEGEKFVFQYELGPNGLRVVFVARP